MRVRIPSQFRPNNVPWCVHAPLCCCDISPRHGFEYLMMHSPALTQSCSECLLGVTEQARNPSFLIPLRSLQRGPGMLIEPGCTHCTVPDLEEKGRSGWGFECSPPPYSTGSLTFLMLPGHGAGACFIQGGLLLPVSTILSSQGILVGVILWPV